MEPKSEARIRYADLIDREHHVSKKRPPMDPLNRAAQFSPFAALSGYEDLIRESERETDSRRELDEERKSQLNALLSRLIRQNGAQEAVFTYFAADEKKEGGEYRTAAGRIKKFDALARTVLLEDGEKIPVDDISGIEILRPEEALTGGGNE